MENAAAMAKCSGGRPARRRHLSATLLATHPAPGRPKLSQYQSCGHYNHSTPIDGANLLRSRHTDAAFFVEILCPICVLTGGKASDIDSFLSQGTENG